MLNRSDPIGEPKHPRSGAFLLAQLGAHAADRFAALLSQVQLRPAHAGILRVVARTGGVSQRALSSTLNMLPSRLVPLLDELEERGLLQRRDNPDDRRLYALHLTEQGAKILARIGRIARAHDDEICAALDEREREQLGALLRKIADEQGLTPGVHPGFAKSEAKQPRDLRAPADEANTALARPERRRTSPEGAGTRPRARVLPGRHSGKGTR